MRLTSLSRVAQGNADSPTAPAVWWLVGAILTAAVVLLSIYRDTIIEKCVPLSLVMLVRAR